MVIRPLSSSSGDLPTSHGRSRSGRRQVVTSSLVAIRTDPAASDGLLGALRLLAGSVDVLSRQVQSLEAKTPGAPDVLSVAETCWIYRVSRTKLYQLSNPNRPEGQVLTRVKRRGGGTGFLRAEIERWVRGLPTKSREETT